MGVLFIMSDKLNGWFKLASTPPVGERAEGRGLPEISDIVRAKIKKAEPLPIITHRKSETEPEVVLPPREPEMPRMSVMIPLLAEEVIAEEVIAEEVIAEEVVAEEESLLVIPILEKAEIIEEAILSTPEPEIRVDNAELQEPIPETECMECTCDEMPQCPAPQAEWAECACDEMPQCPAPEAEWAERPEDINQIVEREGPLTGAENAQSGPPPMHFPDWVKLPPIVSGQGAGQPGNPAAPPGIPPMPPRTDKGLFAAHYMEERKEESGK